MKLNIAIAYVLMRLKNTVSETKQKIEKITELENQINLIIYNLHQPTYGNRHLYEMYMLILQDRYGIKKFVNTILGHTSYCNFKLSFLLNR